MNCFLSLGSNLGDREKNLIQAIMLLKDDGLAISNVSSLYETQPVNVTSQPWFFNLVLEAETDKTPLELLYSVKDIERKMGRKPSYQNGPRIIDIDILLAEKTIIQTKDLEIPHPKLEKRNFVLVPFKEISPNTIHPVLNKTIEELLVESKDKSEVIRINSIPKKKIPNRIK
ncbi:MAG: 2-amino-4-hydroxy-6-hydroxymethyldihydropteridine diphosphokinase [Candidatus Aminicenantes bacterium]|nr:2-amino-4-hydroxy-6-hydroxymethyldihydropteridine diphosphokinase [Candidatus Aminicenantes bacterium]